VNAPNLDFVKRPIESEQVVLSNDTMKIVRIVPEAGLFKRRNLAHGLDHGPTAFLETPKHNEASAL